jgi:hypothetical protein
VTFDDDDGEKFAFNPGAPQQKKKTTKIYVGLHIDEAPNSRK